MVEAGAKVTVVPSLVFLLCRLQISRYGVVSFGAPLRPCCSEWHPRVAPQPVPFVAPLWSSDSPASVFYRTALGEGEVEQVRRRLVQAYNVQHFEPKIVIVVTWVDLACCAVGTLGKQVSVANAHTYRVMHTHMHGHTGAHTTRTSMSITCSYTCMYKLMYVYIQASSLLVVTAWAEQFPW